MQLVIFSSCEHGDPLNQSTNQAINQSINSLIAHKYFTLRTMLLIALFFEIDYHLSGVVLIVRGASIHEEVAK